MPSGAERVDAEQEKVCKSRRTPTAIHRAKGAAKRGSAEKEKTNSGVSAPVACMALLMLVFGVVAVITMVHGERLAGSVLSKL